MKRLVCLCFCLGAGICYGAYQYIVATDPALAVDPSEPACSAAVPVDARTVAAQTLETLLETRYRTFAVSNTSGLNRLKPPFTLVIR